MAWKGRKRSPWHIRVMVETGATWGQGSQQQLGPGPDLRFLHAGEKLNGGQSVPGGGVVVSLTLNVDRHTHLLRPDSPTNAHCGRFSSTCRKEWNCSRDVIWVSHSPHRRHSWVGLSCSRGPFCTQGGGPPPARPPTLLKPATLPPPSARTQEDGAAPSLVGSMVFPASGPLRCLVHLPWAV